MSIKFAILALLAEKPRHGYEIKNEFDRRTNHTWPLNIGQVYTTLDRLERDGLCYRGEETPGSLVTGMRSKTSSIGAQIIPGP